MESKTFEFSCMVFGNFRSPSAHRVHTYRTVAHDRTLERTASAGPGLALIPPICQGHSASGKINPGKNRNFKGNWSVWGWISALKRRTSNSHSEYMLDGEVFGDGYDKLYQTLPC